MTGTPPPPPASPPPAATPDLQPPTASATSRPWWQRTWAMVSAIVAVLGAVTGVIGIWPLVFRNATTLDSLTVAVEPAESPRVTVFAVPITAAWNTFPTSESVCDPGQLAWLEANGARLTERFLVSVSNTADDGAMLSLKDFRGQGDASAPDPMHVAVTCDEAGAGASNLRSALIDPATDRIGVYVAPDPAQPVSPLVFNLAPGENGQFALNIRSSGDFAGTIVFTEALGDDVRLVTLPIDRDLDVPGTATTRFAVVDGRLACEAVADCTPTDTIAALLRASGLS